MADDITYMRNFLATGGRIAFCGEHPGFFASGDGYITRAVAALGGNFSILNSMHSPTSGIVTGAGLAKGSSLTDGVTGFCYAAAPEISYIGRAQVVLDALDGLPLVIDQAVGKGRITMFTDINAWDPVASNSTNQGNNGILFANLMKDAKANQGTVATNGDPNIGYGDTLSFTVNFSETETVDTITGTPALSITIGSTKKEAIYAGGSGSTAIVFKYTIDLGDFDSDGIAINGVSLNGGSIKNNNNDNADITLNKVGVTTGVKVCSLRIVRDNPRNVTAGTLYLFTLTSNGGIGEKSYSAVGLPSWLSLSSEGILSGTPAASDCGSCTFTATVTDDGNSQASDSCEVTIIVSIPYIPPAPSPVVEPTVPTSVVTPGQVIDSTTGQVVQTINTSVTTESNGTKTVAMIAAQALILTQPNGNKGTIADLSRLGFGGANGNNFTLLPDGTIRVKGLANGTELQVPLNYNLGKGQSICIGNLAVGISGSGAVCLKDCLIDPYGIITDSSTGQVISGANVTLYYADTERNKANEKTPNTVVQLPIIEGFKPNDNKNPQVSDDSGAYGFMVFPTSDYYLVATKDGYQQYKSPTIFVEQEIVKWDFKMKKDIAGVNTTIEYALGNKNFYNFNMAYAQIINLSDENQKKLLLSKLATISKDIWTPYVTKAVSMLEKVCNQKDGRIYAETEAFLKRLSEADMDKMTQGYLLGQLTSWGRDFVFTADYTKAVDSLNEAWAKKDTQSKNIATINIGQVKNQASREYLIEELNKLIQK